MSFVEIVMPAEDREGTEATVGRWLKQPGEAVQEHEPVLEITTDKVTLEVPAPATGIVAELRKNEGDRVVPGECLGRVSTDGVQRPTATKETEDPNATEASLGASVALSEEAEGLSPAVRRLLREHRLKPETIPKIARGTRLTVADVEGFLAHRVAPAITETPLAMRKGRRVPHTTMRKSIAAHMARSVQAAPHVTSVFEADLFKVLQDREKRRQNAAPSAGPSITAYLIHAAVQAIRAVPEVNSRWHDDHLEVFDSVDFGVGTALDTGGLVVPVLREVEGKTLETIAEELRRVTEKARAGKLTREEMEGGTFTLSNHGVSGSLLASPIILPHGQSAILGAGKLQKRVIVCETGGRELFRVRPMMYVTLTVDHRALDGQQTNAFLTRFVAALENFSV